MGEVLIEERHGATQLLCLNRPEKRNALDPDLVAALGAALLSAEADDGIRAIVLTGAGDRAFCAGMDLQAFSKGKMGGLANPDPETKAFFRLGNGELAKPVIGAANAGAHAGGFELLLGCDLVVASAHAQFSLPETKRGLFASWNGYALANRIPLAIALELLLTGDPIDAARARELGLVNHLVEPQQVVQHALEVAEKITGNGPLAVAASRELARLAMRDPAAAAVRKAELQKQVFASEDAREASRAFLEKRAPVWQGR